MPHDRLGAPDPANDLAEIPDERPAPGRSTLIEQLGYGLVQRRAITGAPTDAIFAPLQLHEDGGGATSDDDTHAAAAQGIAGAGGSLPHAGAIQRSFGRHASTIAGVRAHTGGEAATAASAIGAEAYTTGEDIAFRSAPDLHLAAHEAAHVVQQRAGVHLKGGVGAAGDPYERHADRVADAVVSGQSAEAILDEHAGGSATRAVQRFEEGEHAEIGIEASDDRVVELATGYVLPFGFITMLAGDHFGSLEEMKKVAKKKPNGADTREEIGYWISDSKLLPELKRIWEEYKAKDPHGAITKGLRRAYYEASDRSPDSFSKEAVASATFKYKQLALRNYSHFDQPFADDDGKASPITMEEQPVAGNGESRTGEANPSGVIAKWVDQAPQTAPRAYRYHHLLAISEAVEAGIGGKKANDAILREGFASHFLSDSFAAGHARTQRFSIQQYWNAKVPMFGLNMRGYLAEVLSEELSGSVISEARTYEGIHLGRIGIDVIDDNTNKEGAYDQISDALSDITGFGFGDLVSAVVHDYDNVNGIFAEVNGETVSLFGDGNLEKGDTKRVAVEAVRLGIADIDDAFRLAQGGTGFDEVVGALIQDDGFFRAEHMIPTAQPDYADDGRDNKNAPRWDFSSLQSLLADPTFQEGLAITMKEKQGQFKAAVADKGSDIKAAFKKRVLDKLNDPSSSLGFLQNVIDWTPVLRVSAAAGGGYSVDEAYDYVDAARDTDGGLASLTLQQRKQLLMVLQQDSSSTRAQQAMADVRDSAPAGDKATLEYQYGTGDSGYTESRSSRPPMAHAE